MTQQEFFKRYSYKPTNDKLGGGSFGKVYKAYDTVLDKFVAVKVAEQIEVGGKTFSLLDEFKALENLPDHVNVAKYEQLYTYESPQGIFDYAVMQYYAGGNLSQLINAQSLTLEQKEHLALQLLEGIAFLHSHKVVHRDLKPSNILIHKRQLRGEVEYIPKISDFGLSKKAGSQQDSHFTNSIAAGTYAYSSPEQLKVQELRFNTDWWSYGAIVYEIFTGKQMFQLEKTSSGSSAMDVREILDNILKSDIAIKIRELPEKWQAVAAACLQRDANRRVKTAEEIKALLEKSAKQVDKQSTELLNREETIINALTPQPESQATPAVPYSQKKTDIKSRIKSFHPGLSITFGCIVVSMLQPVLTIYPYYYGSYDNNYAIIDWNYFFMSIYEVNWLPIPFFCYALWLIVVYYANKKKSNILLLLTLLCSALYIALFILLVYTHLELGPYRYISGTYDPRIVFKVGAYVLAFGAVINVASSIQLWFKKRYMNNF
ncbi:serine/threonine-protein kinase [Tannerella forsythia]|uniref:Serine/threonine protein kinase n=1 Tax=Tannerella forsythia TaxID=28112 RepID=A0A3P1XKB7_TANFO|nr:serine/threonine-protein kinase [Tannerella forsythia]RRD58357.1 serine/threonine protein kinase [Tannerella forsythia]